MTRISYLLTSTILVVSVLVVIHLADLQRELDRELLDIMAETQEQLEKTRQENMELRQLLDERPWVELDQLLPEDLERIFETLGKPGMAGLGEALCRAEAETGVDAYLLAGIIALETGWGTSALARDKNNMGGLGAYDGNEYEAAIRFNSREDSVLYLARLVAGSRGLDDIGRWYATDPAWSRKAAGCREMIQEVVSNDMETHAGGCN